MSSDLERLRDLLSKTEKNIKIIEAVNGNFALAVLNEWRYSTWHVLSACLDEEGNKKEQMARRLCRNRLQCWPFVRQGGQIHNP